MAFLLGRASLNDKAGCCGDDGWQLIEIVGSLSSHSEAEARRGAVGLDAERQHAAPWCRSEP